MIFQAKRMIFFKTQTSVQCPEENCIFCHMPDVASCLFHTKLQFYKFVNTQISLQSERFLKLIVSKILRPNSAVNLSQPKKFRSWFIFTLFRLSQVLLSQISSGTPGKRGQARVAVFQCKQNGQHHSSDLQMFI